ncbi:MAG TPA: [NiFe]-hydrogenase assembly chaperone HybE [Lamprocystis sp. (in: g-proteobacteria)]|nr:[NiFe]-hydrogenase assembly chaperone HybE [Lamprocystis sp. (in: g-proteobacteria)]
MVDPEQQSLTERIERTFEQIYRERMAGLPILNPDLAVKLVGLRAWAGGWVGVLVTPWMMNLIALPGANGADRPGAAGSQRGRAFTSGEYQFTAGADPVIGRYETCSLFSPMGTFPDQETAVATAESILTLLLDAPPADTAQPAPDHPPQRTLSRRGLLRAALGGGA